MPKRRHRAIAMITSASRARAAEGDQPAGRGVHAHGHSEATRCEPSSRLRITAWLIAVTPTRRPACTSRTIIAVPVCVLPVPGGPWIASTERSSATATASALAWPDATVIADSDVPRRRGGCRPIFAPMSVRPQSRLAWRPIPWHCRAFPDVRGGAPRGLRCRVCVLGLSRRGSEQRPVLAVERSPRRADGARRQDDHDAPARGTRRP